jgi:hypothetical protein
MISFFHRHTRSGEIRGRQIGAFLGAKINPERGYEDDTCIYVKQTPPENYPKRTWVDILDGPRLGKWLSEHSDVGIIASSVSGFRYLARHFRNEVVLIPQHHCNFNREVRQEFEHKVGVIGGKGAIQSRLPLAYEHCTRYKTRMDVVEFYRTIDIQIVLRPMRRPLKNPLKLVNAMSFGIPTVAFPEIAYEEVENFYIPASTPAEAAKEVANLTYDVVRELKPELIQRAEEYHIENIAERYRRLEL